VKKDTGVENYAAVDLGSNSFHMIVASYNDGRIQVIDRIKNMVRLASGLDDKGRLSEESISRATECLETFAQRIRGIPADNVRVVGTNTLRRASNGRRFLAKAHKKLGVPVEIISGREEARLIYLGVAHTVYDDTDKRLVIDIGGGSTELIIGKGFDIHRMESIYVGCVGMSLRYFTNGEISAKAMEKAVLATRQELEPVETLYKKTGWNRTIGASGTIRTISNIISNKGQHSITRPALERLKAELVRHGNIDQVKYEELSLNRKPVFAGGLAILCGIFDAFEIEQLDFSDGALREGLLYDLIGRRHDRDVRDSTVAELARRYAVDQEQADRVRDTVSGLFRQVSPAWELDGKNDLKFLEWAARLHEIGLAIAHAQYHRHSAYLLANSDMAGFSRQEQHRLSLLVRGHRRKLPLAEIEHLTEGKDRTVRLIILLRLAIVLNRSRLNSHLPKMSVTVSAKSIRVVFPRKWFEKNPLTRADLEAEAGFLDDTGYTLSYTSG